MTSVPVGSEALPARARSSGSLRRFTDALTAGWAYVGAGAAIVFLVALVAVLLTGAWPAMQRFGIAFLWSGQWNHESQQFGALAAIEGTLVSSFIAILLAVPVSVGTAIYLVRLAPRWMVTPVSFLVELLAAIPSITFGMWGMLVLVPFLRLHVTPWIEGSLGRLHWFHISEGYDLPGAWFESGGNSSHFFAAGVVLAIMITPIITAISRDVLMSVPGDLEQGAYGLGATWWQATRVVLSHARTGILGAVILGLGRALGETMAVTMVIGNANETFSSFFRPGYSIASLLANQFPNASTDLQRESLVYTGLILLIVTMCINAMARLFVARTGRAAR